MYQNYKVIRKGKLIYKGKFQNGEQLETYKIEIPKNFICPISFKIMKNPHQTTIGSVYEKDAIEKWLKTNNTDPLTNVILQNKMMSPNIVAKNIINEWREKYKN